MASSAWNSGQRSAVVDPPFDEQGTSVAEIMKHSGINLVYQGREFLYRCHRMGSHEVQGLWCLFRVFSDFLWHLVGLRERRSVRFASGPFFVIRLFATPAPSCTALDLIDQIVGGSWVSDLARVVHYQRHGVGDCCAPLNIYSGVIPSRDKAVLFGFIGIAPE